MAEERHAMCESALREPRISFEGGLNGWGVGDAMWCLKFKFRV